MKSLAFVACLGIAQTAMGCKAQGEPGAHPSGDSTPARVATPTGRLRVVGSPPVGDVRPVIREATEREALEKRRVVVYVGAAWCEPCTRFSDAAKRGELDSSFGDVTLLEFDLDRDAERLGSAGYVSQYIPLFALPAADGAASGKQIEGAIKGDGAVAFLVPRLARLLAQ